MACGGCGSIQSDGATPPPRDDEELPTVPITTIDKQQRTEALAEVGHLAASIEGAPEAELIEAYFRHAPAEDVTSRSPRGLLDLVIAHRELSQPTPSCASSPTTCPSWWTRSVASS